VLNSIEFDNIQITNLSGRGLIFQAKMGFIDKTGKVYICGAVDYNKKRAIVRAINEYNERLFARYNQDINLSNGKSSRTPILSPALFLQFSQEVRWAKLKNHRFVQVIELVTGNKLLAPADVIFLNYSDSFKSKLTIDATGLASHKKFDNAILSGLFEVIERDQINLFWSIRDYACQKIIGYNKRISKKIGKMLRKEGHKIILLYLDGFRKAGVHVVVACLFDKTGKIIFGSAANDKIRLAIEKSIFECLMLRNTVLEYQQQSNPITNLSLLHVINSYNNSRRVSAYLLRKIKSKIQFSNLSTRKKANFKEIESIFACKIYYYKFAAPQGINVVRVFVPNAQRKPKGFSHNKLIGKRFRFFNDVLHSKVNLFPSPYG